MNWHIESIESCEKKLSVDIKKGIEKDETERRRERYGSNRSIEKRRRSFPALFFGQFKNTLVAVVFFAAIVSAVIAVNAPEIGNWKETLVVAFLLVVRALTYALCEWRNDNSRERLRRLSMPYARVLRGGEREVIPAEDIVVGDIVLLDAGDIAPADGRIVECDNMTCDERKVSGDAVSAIKVSDAAIDVTAPINERVNMVYSGCPVLTGSGVCIVTAVGAQTEMGRKAGLLVNDVQEQTPLRRLLDDIRKKLGIAALILCALILLIGFIKRYSYDLKAIEVFMTATALAVTVMPVGIHTIVAAILNRGRLRAAQNGAFIADDPSVERLDKVSVICSDKTGTLTKRNMTLCRIWTPGGKLYTPDGQYMDKNALQLLQYAALCCDYRPGTDTDDIANAGQSAEKAIVSALLRYDIKKSHLDMKYPRISERPFDSDARYMMTGHNMPGGGRIEIMRGAPDAVLPMCSGYDADKATAMIDHMGADGLRVIAVAYRNDDAESFAFMGLLGIASPPRSHIHSAVERCGDAGIRVVMFTSEPETAARTIASDLGILREGDEVMTGEKLAAMSDDELDRNIRKYSVYAHINPSGKLRVTDAWKRSGECVAVTGDGVADEPVLRSADVGFAMGRSGVSLTRNAAAVTVTDNSFATIMGAIREGRGICDNIRGALRMMLAYSTAMLLTMLTVILIKGTVPMLSVHLLTLSIITGVLPMLSFAWKKPGELTSRPIHSDNGRFLYRLGAGTIAQMIVLTALAVTAFFIGLNDGIETARTMTFVTLGLCQITNIPGTSFKDFLYKYDFRGNIKPVITFVMMIAAMVVSMLVVREPLQLTALSGEMWHTVVLLALIPPALWELFKLLRILLGKYIYIGDAK